MPGYFNQGSSIGSLLRFIQEQKSQSPIIPPKSESGSPIRNVVQQPLSGSEGQGTSKVVSIRPEGTLTPSGQPIEQGTPQSSRVGPISIGGEDVGAAPVGVVAANEPGEGFTIPSASRTAGDVVNKTGAAAGPPSLGTSIKAKTPTTVRGQSVVDYSLLRDKAKADKTSEDVKLALAEGERSLPETQAKIEDIYRRSQELQQELTEEDQALLNRPLSDRALAETRKLRDAIIARGRATPEPTPTPSPTRSDDFSGGSGSQVLGASSGGQNRSVPAQIMSPVKKPYDYSSAKSTPAPVQMQSKPAPKPAPAPKAPSIGTVVGGGALAAFKKLFGR